MKDRSIWAACLLVLASCASYRGVPINQVDARVRIGDRVRVTTNEREKLRFRVESVDATHLAGSGQRVEISDLSLVEVQRLDKERSAGGLATYFLLGPAVTFMVAWIVL